MYRVVYQLLIDNPSITALIKSFASAIVILGENIVLLGGKEEERTSAAKGKAAAKEDKETLLKDTVFSIAAAIYSYAAEAGNIELKTKARVTRTQLRVTREADLIPLAKNIFNLGTTYATALADYDVSAEDLTELDQLISTYGTAKTSVGTGIAQRKSAGQTQTEIVEATDIVLRDRLDKYVERLKTKQPEFYKQYRAARVIRDVGGTGGKDTPPPPTP
jgi:hypothetical protein